jgi:uncharacterized membrane protein YfcA
MSDTWFLLLSAALGAGALNALAGGGSFLTLPALFQVGLPPIAANATSTVAVSPATWAARWASGPSWPACRPACCGRTAASVPWAAWPAPGCCWSRRPGCSSRWCPGCCCSPPRVRGGPWLIRRRTRRRPRRRWRLAPGLAAVSVYGGYFNGGLGILLLALYQATGVQDLREANALKNLNSLVLSPCRC